MVQELEKIRPQPARRRPTRCAGVLATLGGFSAARPARRFRRFPEEMTGTALWAIDRSRRPTPTTIAALTVTPDLPALFRSTIEAVVESHVPA